jgi:hypothetical protein
MENTVDTSGPVFDGRSAAIMARGVTAVRQAIANDVKRTAAASFTGNIRVNHGVFLSTLTIIGSSRVFEWEGFWTKDNVHNHPRKGRHLVNRTYTMPITVENPVTDLVVTTRLSMYGPWLEGTGSRNETTRFKGYHGFRVAATVAGMRAETTAERALDPYVADLNS